MAFKIPEYRERVSSGSAGAAPRLDPSAANLYDVGADISAAANEAERAFNAYRHTQMQDAESDSLAAIAELQMAQENAFMQAREQAEPGAKNFTPSFMENYNSAVDARSADMDVETQKRFRERAKRLEVQLQGRALTFEAQERQSHRIRNFDTAADAAASTLFSTDADQRADAHTAAMAEFMTSLSEIDLEPGQKLDIAKAAERKLSFAAVQGDLRDRPEHVQDWLVGQKGADYYAKLRGVESGGRNIGSDTSSAFGPYQFTAGTWDSLLKRHPELELTAEDRFKPAAQEIAIRAFTEDNAKILASMGYAATNANLYMMHFLGEGGGPRFLRALKGNAEADARSFVSSEAVKANPAIFRPGRTVEEVYAIFARKFGMTVQHDADSGAPGYYSRLSFEHRNQLYGAAETEMNRRRTDATAAFKQRTDNAIAEVAANGNATDAPSEEEFLAAYGPERGTLAHGEFIAGYRAAEAGHTLQRAPLDQHAGIVERLKPEQGDEFYAEKLAGYEQARVLSAQLTTAARDDSAAFILSASTDTQAAFAELGGEGKTLAEQRASTAKYAALMDREADRLGIPGQYRRLLSKGQTAAIAADLNQTMLSDTGTRAKVVRAMQMKDAWGKHWPRIYSDLGDKLSAPLQAATSGVSLDVATAILSVHDKSFEDLMKPLPADMKIDLTERLQSEFAPFIESTGFHLSASPWTAMMFEQAKKLAALYATAGESMRGSAEKAFNGLLGDKYRFEASGTINLRIPRVNDFDGIEAAADRVRRDIIESGPVQILADPFQKPLDPASPPVDTGANPELRGLRPEYMIARTRDWLEREARLVTLPDDSGVALYVKGHMWNFSDGRPLTWTWDQLHNRGKEFERRDEEVRANRVDVFEKSLRQYHDRFDPAMTSGQIER